MVAKVTPTRHQPHIATTCPVCGVKLESWVVAFRGDTLVTMTPASERHIEAHYDA
jgi:hypothetical protein